MQGKYLITTENWFYAPDGKQYRAVWGEVKLLQTKDVLGVDPNRVTANWTLQVGTEEDHILIGGCQVNYSVKCPNRPNTKVVEQVIQGEKKVDVPAIYIPEALEVIPATEVIDGKTVVWKHDKDELLSFLMRKGDKISSSAPHLRILLDKITEQGIIKWRSYRKTYAKYITIEIHFKNEDHTGEVHVPI